MFDLHKAEIPFLMIRSTVDEACEDILAQGKLRYPTACL